MAARITASGAPFDAFRRAASVSVAITVTISAFLSCIIPAAANAGPIIDAIRAGDAAAVARLLEANGDPNERERDGTTALHWAVHHGADETVAALLAAGADADARNRYGVPPVHLAAQNGSAAIVRQLLAAGIDPDSALPEGETALMTAARTGDAGTIEALIAAGADVDAREAWKGQTALMWAAAANNAAAVESLLEAGAELAARSAKSDFTALTFAVRHGAIDATRALLAAGGDVDATLASGASLLVLAVTNAHWELAGVLLEHGADPNAAGQGWAALHQIAWSRRWNMGFNLPGPYATGDLGSLDLVARLVEAGADVDARQTAEPVDGNRNKLNRIGATPFLLAAKSNDLPLMRKLLELGADPSIPTENRTTALMAAAGVGIWAPGENPGTHEESLAAVELAIEVGGGDVNDVNDEGDTALHGAVYRGGNISVIEYLIARGAKLDVVNELGWSPVTVADGVEYTPAVLKRYPEAAAVLRRRMAEQGLEVPPSSQPGS